MRIISEKVSDECLERPLQWEVELAAPVTRDVIEQMRRFGDVEYHRGFLKPLYRLEVTGRFWIKGVQGSSKMRLILCRNDFEGAMAEFREMVGRLESERDARAAVEPQEVGA